MIRLVTLLSTIGKRRPDEMVRHLSMLEKLIADSDIKYWAREAALSVISEIYKQQVRKESASGERDPLNQSQMHNSQLTDDSEDTDSELSVKDRAFKLLTAHLFDRNAYARTGYETGSENRHHSNKFGTSISPQMLRVPFVRLLDKISRLSQYRNRAVLDSSTSTIDYF